MIPNLNKWHYQKLHRKKRLKNLEKGEKGKTFSIYNSGVILKKSQLITIKQYSAVKKYISKKLKGKKKKNKRNFNLNKMKEQVTQLTLKKKEKTVIIRRNFDLGLTKKPLQVRMGKGKGFPEEWISPIAKSRIFIEFLISKHKKNKLLRIFKNLETKLANSIKIRYNKSKKLYRKKLMKNIKCVKEV